MKRIILAVCFIIASGAGYNASAQTATPVSSTTFTSKVNQLDSYLASGDTAHARSTWNDIHNLMMQEFGAVKVYINTATTTTDRTTYMNLHNTQYNYYQQAWNLKNDLVTNRSSIHTALMSYAGTL